MNIHPNVSKYSFLIGKWVTSKPAEGIYPTIQPFTYTEEIDFGTVGKPFISYQQKTWNSSKQPLHSESGFLRFPPNNTIEWVNSEPTGITEIYEGKVEENDEHIKLLFKLVNIQRTPTAKAPQTKYVERNFTFDKKNNTLSYTLDMSTETTKELTRHLEAHFEKIN